MASTSFPLSLKHRCKSRMGIELDEKAGKNNGSVKGKAGNFL